MWHVAWHQWVEILGENIANEDIYDIFIEHPLALAVKELASWASASVLCSLLLLQLWRAFKVCKIENNHEYS